MSRHQPDHHPQVNKWVVTVGSPENYLASFIVATVVNKAGLTYGCCIAYIPDKITIAFVGISSTIYGEADNWYSLCNIIHLVVSQVHFYLATGSLCPCTYAYAQYHCHRPTHTQ